MNKINQKEIRIVGLRRSGNHAVISWIYKNTTGGYLFLNNCVPRKNPLHNPKLQENRRSYKFETNIAACTLENECHGRHIPKDLLIYNYEDKLLKDVALDSPQIRASWWGQSQIHFDVLILRDPYNMLASLLQFLRNKKKPHRVIEKVLHTNAQLWVAYAREFLKQTNFLPNKIPISFNAWHTDAEYRHGIQRQLRLDTTDIDIDKIPRWGGGSSFIDGRAESASLLKIHKRWEVFVDDPVYLNAARKPELRHLSEVIFGNLNGTETLVPSGFD